MLPEQRFAEQGRFRMDGIGLDDLLRAGSTPCYAYSASTIRSQYRKLAQAFPGFDLFYSFKANPNLALVRLLRGLGAGAEVSSAGELRLALDAGFPPGDIILVAPAKTDAEIALGVSSDIHALVVDSAVELEQVERAARDAGRDARVMLRVNTRERPDAGEVMVGGPSKFGFDEEQLIESVRSVRLMHARITGIQVYSASQVLDPGFLSDHIEYVFGLARTLSAELGVGFDTIDFGGGFGVPYEEGDVELDLGPVAATAARLRAEREDRLQGCRLVLESGRYIVAEAGLFLARVVRVKRSRGKTFVITDGGMNGFSRPVFMRVAHRIRLLNKFDREPAGPCDVCGPICTPIDCLGQDVPLPEPEPGDIVGVFCAGAYGYTMSLLGFMSRGAPAELLADSGDVTVIRDPRS